MFKTCDCIYYHSFYYNNRLKFDTYFEITKQVVTYVGNTSKFNLQTGY